MLYRSGSLASRVAALEGSTGAFVFAAGRLAFEFMFVVVVVPADVHPDEAIATNATITSKPMRG
jgi:hypothetical protein